MAFFLKGSGGADCTPFPLSDSQVLLNVYQKSDGSFLTFVNHREHHSINSINFFRVVQGKSHYVNTANPSLQNKYLLSISLCQVLRDHII